MFLSTQNVNKSYQKQKFKFIRFVVSYIWLYFNFWTHSTWIHPKILNSLLQTHFTTHKRKAGGLWNGPDCIKLIVNRINKKEKPPVSRCAVSCVCVFMSKAVYANYRIKLSSLTGLDGDRSLSFASQRSIHPFGKKSHSAPLDQNKKAILFTEYLCITLIILLQKRTLLFSTYCLHKKIIEHTVLNNIHKIFHMYVRHHKS